MKYRVVTTDTADDGQKLVDQHAAVDTFDEARQAAEEIREDHEVVSVHRYSNGEPDLMWSSRAEEQ